MPPTAVAVAGLTLAPQRPAELLSGRLSSACSCSPASAAPCYTACTHITGTGTPWSTCHATASELARIAAGRNGHACISAATRLLYCTISAWVQHSSPIISLNSCQWIWVLAIAQQPDLVVHLHLLHTQSLEPHFACNRSNRATTCAGSLLTGTDHGSAVAFAAGRHTGSCACGAYCRHRTHSCVWRIPHSSAVSQAAALRKYHVARTSGSCVCEQFNSSAVSSGCSSPQVATLLGPWMQLCLAAFTQQRGKLTTATDLAPCLH